MYHERLKSLIPLEKIEPEAQTQIWKNLEHDFLIKMAIMPDCHMGYNLPIGGVALLDNVISPSYVGYDISCGVSCVIGNLKFSELSEKDKWDILNRLYKEIPNGVGQGQNKIKYTEEFKSAIEDKKLDDEINLKLNKQYGSLGSGNHFLELGKNNDGFLSVVIHSGSRKPGWLVGNYYMKLSKIEDKDLPRYFFHLNGHLGKCYEQDMNFMIKYAYLNRSLMMKQTLKIIGFSNIEVDEMMKNKLINETHNHAERYKTNENWVLHRKGATPADFGQFGIIPGNMRDGSYVTSGLGNDEYLSSASHGAGRKMSRTKAKENISLDKLRIQMKDKIVNLKQSLCDEGPDAYKDLDMVIKYQENIVVKIVDKITSELNVKG